MVSEKQHILKTLNVKACNFKILEGYCCIVGGSISNNLVLGEDNFENDTDRYSNA